MKQPPASARQGEPLESSGKWAALHRELGLGRSLLLVVLGGMALYIGIANSEAPLLPFIKAKSGLPSVALSEYPLLYWAAMAICLGALLLGLVVFVANVRERLRPAVSVNSLRSGRENDTRRARL